MCFELKPKCGFVARHWTVLPSRRGLWWKHPQYALHQCLKRNTPTGGSVLSLKSEYNPCDLFSRQPRRKLRALRALFASPQNNLAAFVDGIPTALTRLPDAAVLTAAGTATAEQEQAAPISTESLMQHVLVAILVAEELLAQLLNLQSLCELDPVAAWELYVEESKAEGVELHSIPQHGSSIHDARFVQELKAWARSQPSPERIRMLREYLLSCMARDASVMIAVEPTAAEDEVRDSAGLVSGSISDGVFFAVRPGIGGSLTLASAGLSRRISWKHQAYLVDLDRKPLAKIAAHVTRDACISRAAEAYFLD
ncbi:hypothetical protein H632_c563p1 [Helicosporidium sp. ATCC 50920]|nr:hypothetical protein H632_c563p1 [Helicosporidium sp. ATCC 50920]|eukprot:KDD75662.1 hypothetical protein H632_c563p1 [Helicosporidium sp. ATCC 50920]